MIERNTEPERRTASRVSRRKFLAAAGVTGAGALAGCLSGFGGGNQVSTLRVAPWSGPYADNFEQTVAASFEEETGIEVEISPQWAEMLAKVRSAPEDSPPYDIMTCHGDYLLRGTADGLLGEVDRDNIPNLDNVHSIFLDDYRTQYLQYGVPADGAPQGIVYNPSELAFEPTSWSDFLRDDVTKGALEGGFWTDTMAVVAVMVEEMVGTAELYQEDTHQQVFDTLRDLDEEHISRWTTSGAQVWQGFDQGLINLSMYAFGSGFNRTQEKDDLEIVLPQVSYGYFDHYVRVRGTDPKKEAIEQFLNHMLDPEVQTAWHEAGTNMMSTGDVEYIPALQDAYPTSSQQYAELFKGFIDFEKMNPHYDKLGDGFKNIVQS